MKPDLRTSIIPSKWRSIFVASEASRMSLSSSRRSSMTPSKIPTPRGMSSSGNSVKKLSRSCLSARTIRAWKRGSESDFKSSMPQGEKSGREADQDRGHHLQFALNPGRPTRRLASCAKARVLPMGVPGCCEAEGNEFELGRRGRQNTRAWDSATNCAEQGVGPNARHATG